MRKGRITSAYLNGYQFGGVYVGYRRMWLRNLAYVIRNYEEHSLYAGIGPLYLKIRESRRRYGTKEQAQIRERAKAENDLDRFRSEGRIL